MDERWLGRVSLATDMLEQIHLIRSLPDNYLLALEKEELTSIFELFLKQHGLWEAATEAWEERKRSEVIVAFEREP
jgi:hypothetical protein